jgi:hypothetical protein
VVARILLLLAVATSLVGLVATGDAQAMAFLTGGMLALLGALSWIYGRLIRPKEIGNFAWSEMSRLNLSRQPQRSLLIVALVGIATFLILAVSAFRLGPTERGTAGFDFLVQTDTGILQDLNSSESKVSKKLHPLSSTTMDFDFTMESTRVATIRSKRANPRCSGSAIRLLIALTKPSGKNLLGLRRRHVIRPNETIRGGFCDWRAIRRPYRW